MAKKPAQKPRRDDWAQLEEIELTNGQPAVTWHNLITGERATLRPGVHPFDNLNAAQLPVVLAPPPDVDEPDDGSEDDPDFIEPTAVDRVITMLHGVSDDQDARAIVKLYRVREGQTKPSWCADYTPDVFEAGSLEMIRKQWGPGKYQIRVYAQRTNSRQFSLRANETIDIEEPREPLNANPAAPTDAFSRVLDKIVERLDRIENRPQPDANQQMMATLSMMKAMREAMGINNAPAQTASPVSTIKELAMTMQVLRSMREEIMPEPGDSDPLLSSLPKVLELVQAGMRGNGAQPAQELPTVHVPPALAAPMAIPTQQPMQQTAANESEDQAMQALNGAVSLLNLKAMTNSDAAESAELVYEHAPDEVLALLHTNEWWDALSKLAPSVVPYKAWYEQVRAHVLRIEAEEAQEASEAQPPAKSAASG